MRILLTIFILIFFHRCLGQGFEQLSSGDSVLLEKHGSIFFANLLNKNFNKIESESLSQIYCLPCQEKSAFVPFSKVQILFNDLVKNPEFVKLIELKRKTFSYIIHYFSENEISPTHHEYLVYQISIEYEYEKKGFDHLFNAAYVFQFVKQENEFKFYGLELLP